MDNTEVKLKFTNSVTGEKKLEKYAETLSRINSFLAGMDKNKVNQINSSVSGTKEIKEDSKQLGRNLESAFKLGAVVAFNRALAKTIQTFTKLSKQSFDYLENFNLFQVAFEGNYQTAEKFANTMSEMYGLDESWTIRTVGIFKQLSNAMNLSVETGERLSQLLTQMSLDISSLYNVDIERASSVLQSALAGQTKPIRGTTGADITEATLQTTLAGMGINKGVDTLSYAEKRLLIIISLTKQLNASIGDMGRTIESPSNQMRVMNEQWERLTRAVGNLFLPVLSKILPYLNAILMVLTEIISAVATFLGFSQDDYDYFAGTADSVLELEENLDGATESAKALKRGLRGFDKLNVITTPSSGGASVGAGAGGLNADILKGFNEAFDEYNSKLGKVQMKATKIRDAIMEWLGFSKEINPITGDISFKYQGMTTTLRNIYNWFKKLSPTGKALVGIFAGLVTANTIKTLTKFTGLIGKTGAYKWVTSLLSPMKNLGEYTKVYTSMTGSLNKGLEGAIDSWSKNLSVMDRMKVTLVGATGLVVSLGLVKDAMKGVAEEGWNLKNGLEAGLGVLGSIGSGALIGSQFGAIGAIIGGVTGGVVALYEAFMNYPTAVSKATESIKEASKKIHDYNSSLQAQYDAIKQSEIANMSLQTSYQNLLSELINITDENGKVKDGYEERANFIITALNNAYDLEIEMIDGVIQGYQEEIQTIKDVILEKRKQIALESAEQQYAVAMDQKVQTYKNYTDAVKNNKDAIEAQKMAQEKYNKAYEDWVIYTANGTTINAYASLQLKKAREELEKMNVELETSKTELDGATKAYDSNTQAIMTYQGLLTADTQENAELVEKYINDIENSYFDGKEFIKLTYDEQKEDAIEYYSSVLRTTLENEKEITDEVIAQANSRLNSLKTNLTDMTNSVEGTLGESLINAWSTLAQSSESKFLEEFAKLKPDMQTEVVDKMYQTGYEISDELQNGINKINPTIKVKTDLSGANKKIKMTADFSEVEKTTNNFWTKLKNAFLNSFGIKIGALKFANGGLPPVGQLFVANERGPELVGQIGGQSFVANQNQMMDLLDKKIGNAQKGNSPQVFNIYLDENNKLATYVLNDLQETAKTNGKPIKIGG